MLEKRSGHPVFPMDSRDTASLNLHPKETDDVLTEYNTLFSLSASPHPSTAGVLQWPEGLLEGDPQQAIQASLPYLRKASQWNPQSGKTLDPRLGLWTGTGLDSLPLSEDRLSPLSEDSYRRARSLRSLPEGDQETGTLYFRALQDYDRPGGGASSGTGLENSQGRRPEGPGERVREDRLSWPSYPGHRRDLHPQRPPLPDGGSRLRDRTSGLGGQRQKSPDPPEILLGYDIQREKTVESRGDGHVGPLYPGRKEQGSSCQDRLRSLPRGCPIQQDYR